MKKNRIVQTINRFLILKSVTAILGHIFSIVGYLLSMIRKTGKSRTKKSVALLLTVVLVYLSCFAELSHIDDKVGTSSTGRYVSTESSQHLTVCTLCFFPAGPATYTANEHSVSSLLLLCLGCVFLNSIAPPLTIETGVCSTYPVEHIEFSEPVLHSLAPTFRLSPRAPPA